jgi:uncharacterized membrane protein YphA (DoxX/SURF4 family)
MVNISRIGRIFYGAAITEMGLQTIYYKDFPYMLLPPNHTAISGLAILAIIFGVLFALAGVCIIFEKIPKFSSLLLGGVLLLVFCFYYIPYEFIATSNYMHLTEWENAEKELALAGGALVIAGCFPMPNENSVSRFLGKLIPLGPILFVIPIISFGILHFMYGPDVASMVPSWIPYHLFWIYFAGAALIGSGMAIVLKIKVGLFAFLLGLMIFLWVILLHIPLVVASPPADMGDQITSAIIALAYSGTAFVISGAANKKASVTV